MNKEKDFIDQVLKRSTDLVLIDSQQLYDMQQLDLHRLCHASEKAGYRLLIVKGARRMALERIDNEQLGQQVLQLDTKSKKRTVRNDK